MKRVSVESIIVMLLFTLFAASIGILIVEGQESYSAIIEEKEDYENVRIAISYITNRVKQNDHAGNIKVTYIPDVDSKVIQVDLKGVEEGYVTYIYYEDGFLYELYLAEEDEFIKEYAEVITSVNRQVSFKINETYQLLEVVMDGEAVASIHMLEEVTAHE